MPETSNINERILKITGGVYLGGEVDASKSLTLKNGDISIYEVSKRDNQDGTFDIVFKGKFTEGVEFEQGARVLRGKDKTSESKKTRWAIKCFASEIGEEDTEAFYKKFQEKLRSNIMEVWEFLKIL